MRSILFLLLISFSSYAQIGDQRNGLLSGTRFGKGMGIFVNGGSENFEIDGYLDADTDFGLFGDLWFSQIDFDQTTNIEINTSLGYMLQLKPKSAIGFGYSMYSYLGDNISFQNDEGELFLGVIIGPVTGIIFFDNGLSNFNYLSKIDMKYGLLKDVPFEFFFQCYFEEQNYDINLSIIKNIYDHFIFGYMLSREKYDREYRQKFVKNGQSYIINQVQQEEGFFHKIYVGYVF